MNNDEWQENIDRAAAILKDLKRVVVAFSGGVDSTVLAVLANRVLGADYALAVTADSPSLARQDLREAVELARHLGLRHRVIVTHEVEGPGYRLNTAQRCYMCKQELFTELEPLARAQGGAAVVYGAISDDLLEERPGHAAARAHGVRAPLQEAGLEKWELRLLARAWGLPNWNKPQNACLSSRIPHGLEVTEDKLEQIERAETFLLGEGFRQVRVRHLGGHARIEVGPDEVARFEETALECRVVNYFESIGFESVGMDRAGYRAGGADQRHNDEVLLKPVGKAV